MADKFIPRNAAGQKPPRYRTNQAKREWNDRFWIESIPQYNPLQDRHCKFQSGGNYQAMISKRKKVVIGPGRIRPTKYQRELSPGRMIVANNRRSKKKQGIMQQPIINRLKERLDNVWDQFKIPETLRDIFLQVMESLQIRQKASAIAKEIEELNKTRANILYAIQAIIRREDCLEQLHDFAQETDLIENNTQLRQLITLINNYREQTVNVVEGVMAWREQMASYDPYNPRFKSLPFAYNCPNYLLKIKDDTKFLSGTQISSQIAFATKSDPFLKQCSGSAQAKQKQEFTAPFPNNLLKRITSAERVLIEEFAFNQEPMHQPMQREAPIGRGRKRNMEMDKRGSRALSSDVQLDKEEQGLRRSSESSRNLKFLQEKPISDATIEAIEGDIEQQLQDYFSKVPEKIQISLGDNAWAIEKSQALKFPCYLWVKSQNYIAGLVVLNLELQKAIQKRLSITHISATNLESLGTVIQAAIDYIWAQYSCDEVKVGLIPQQDSDGKFVLDQEVKGYLEKAGFRWKTLTNLGGGKSIQIYGIRRPANIECINPDTEALFGDTINFSHITVCGESEAADTNITTSCQIAGILALKNLNQKEIQGVINENLQKLPDSFNIREIRTAEMHNKQEIEKTAEAIGLNFPVVVQQEQASCAITCIGVSWKLAPSAFYNNILYLRIASGDIQKLVNQTQTIYIIPTDEIKYTVFLIPVNDDIDDEFEYSKQIISQGGEMQEMKNNIWIPAFSKDYHQVWVDGGIQYTETGKLQVAGAMHPIGNLQIQPTENCIVLDKPFIFGIINQALEEALDVPFAVAMIRSRDFVKRNK